MGLLVALTPGCQKKCGSENCAGCCTDKAECVGTATDAQCGAAGALCTRLRFRPDLQHRRV